MGSDAAGDDAAGEAPDARDADVADKADDAVIGDRPVRLDAFCGGGFSLYQPKGWGYRSGLDAMLLAACVAEGFDGRIADLGAGSGAAGFAAAHRAPAARVTLAEVQPTMAALCRRSLTFAGNAAVASRIAVAEVDLRTARGSREAAGLADAGFDLVLTNPPFHAPGDRRPPDPVRDRALFASDDLPLARWFAVAAALLSGKGRLVAVLRTDCLGPAIAALDGRSGGRLGGVTVLPVHTRAGAPAERILIAAAKDSRAPLTLIEAIVLNDAAGRPTLLSDAIAGGRATLALAAR
ncbi:tRNA1(Val) (adenine(37)-N6)-methyltransferase [Jiella sonneratiae]|uniref:Methyltransferase n=1 Tax=Jiella sonneratiae TaxID=2816856 RepID=A0ABS3J4B4_9HYPH|nr:methyltransferase [Jiella sonneratiae]MBO0904499.1 methyltransferase [Jiella sonneratiae]